MERDLFILLLISKSFPPINEFRGPFLYKKFRPKPKCKPGEINFAIETYLSSLKERLFEIDISFKTCNTLTIQYYAII